MPFDEIKKLQYQKTKEMLERTNYESEFYCELFNKAKVKPEDFKKLEDIARFPFTNKQDLVMDQEVHCQDEKAICVGNAPLDPTLLQYD